MRQTQWLSEEPHMLPLHLPHILCTYLFHFPPFQDPQMTQNTVMFTFIFTFFLLLETFSAEDPQFLACSASKNCGDGLNISYPFYIENLQEPYCGYPGFKLSCSLDGHHIVKLSENEYIIHEIFYKNQSLRVSDAKFSNGSSECLSRVQNLSFSGDQFGLEPNQIDLVFLYNCNRSLFDEKPDEYKFGCENGSELALLEHDPKLDYAEKRCETKAIVPVQYQYSRTEEMLENGFMLNWTAGDCNMCEASGGKCGFNETKYHFRCFCPDRPHRVRCNREPEKLGLKLALGVGCPGILIICIFLFYFPRWYKQRYPNSRFFSRDISSDPSTRSDLEGGSAYFGIPIFSNRELEEATNNFDHSKELGDGGFGAVYHGKLRDGREVAVKSLYEHNYKRLEQFMNEVQILTRLRHKNLVSLYGCTSPHSRQLLLVYEYISNGTVADHLHGDGAKPGSFPWHIRMSVAIETATSLAYLHASDIIHRDVKTTNILLDSNFCVKVADFGLSRLFPTDVTHVSTAPQGTPGYVDPEYYQCYHLTTKSDVYSFGVVLIELISSMPAVDISRHKHEINLSNMAISKIQKRAFNELVDPNLGFDTDLKTKRMIMLVAELAYQCLQQDKEFRPTMDEVLETLKNIEKGNYKWENSEEADDETGELRSVQPPPSPENDEVGLLKNLKPPPSPDSVAEKWFSTSTTSNASG